MTEIEDALTAHFAATALAANTMLLRGRFRAEGYVELEGLLPSSLWATLRDEVSALIDAHAQRCDVRIAATAQTRRRYAILAYETIARHAMLAPALYASPALRVFLGTITGCDALLPVPYVPERIIATRFRRRGDTHGWHWDDYPYALVWLLRTPPAEAGGGVELVTSTTWNKDDPQVERYLRERFVERRFPQTGSAYLLRADTTLHRVAPLARDAVREVLTFSYTDAADARTDVTHETLHALLDDTSKHDGLTRPY
jgi:hypothetical protein